MKRIGLLFIMLFSVCAISFAQDATFAEFEKLQHDFGQVSDQENAVVKFKFKNTSGKDLILNPPKTSCGCTASNYPKEPIAPGETKEIEVTYSTANRMGKFIKDVKVYAQGYDDPIVIKIKGEVVAPQEISTLPKKQKNSLFK